MRSTAQARQDDLGDRRDPRRCLQTRTQRDQQGVARRSKAPADDDAGRREQRDHPEEPVGQGIESFRPHLVGHGISPEPRDDVARRHAGPARGSPIRVTDRLRGGVHLEASALPAATQQATHVDGDVPQLPRVPGTRRPTRGTTTLPDDVAADREGRGDTGPQEHAQQVLDSDTRTEALLREPGDGHVVMQQHREPEPLAEELRDRGVPPAEVGGEPHPSTRGVDQTGHGDAALTGLWVGQSQNGGRSSSSTEMGSVGARYAFTVMTFCRGPGGDT